MSSHTHIITLALFAASAVGLGSCGLVDTPSAPAAITNVSQFYYPLAQVGANFDYERISRGGSDTVHLTMQGRDLSPSGPLVGGCYQVGLSNADQFRSDLYFVVNDSEAFTLGTISCSSSGSTWLDLKSPLAVGQQWTFNTGNVYYPEFVTATVLRRGAQLKMPDGQIFDDVTEVRYVNTESDTTTKWFARGVGLVYSTSTRADTYFGSQMRILKAAK